MTSKPNNNSNSPRHPRIENASNVANRQRRPIPTVHFLVTLHTFNGVTLNAYRVTAEDEDDPLLPACEALMEKAEELNLHPIPAILATKLSSGVKSVENEINRHKGPKIDFSNKRCLILWMARTDDPINEKLMELH